MNLFQYRRIELTPVELQGPHRELVVQDLKTLSPCCEMNTGFAIRKIQVLISTLPLAV